MLRTTLCTLALLTQVAAQSADEPARLLRFAHVQGDKIVFVKGGDLWTATLGNLRARRLTSYDDGFEVFPRISPDGEHVAFSGEYDGSRQIYIVPFDGGTPKQLTYYPDVGPMPPRGGYDNLPLDWTPDGRHILIRANRTPFGQRVGKYYLVPADGSGLEKPLQIPEGGPASFSPDGSKLAYNIISREWRTWKRYTAGRAQDVYVYDLTGNRVEQMTTWEGTDNHPMWLGDRIYFTSDRSGTLNLWCRELGSGVDRQVTNFTEYDVLWPSRGDSGIVFENGGALWMMKAGTEEVLKLDITLADDQPWTRPAWKDGARRFGSATIADDGNFAIAEFRGDLFLAREGEPTENLTASPARRERNPALSPDGSQVAFVGEAGLDLELFVHGLRFGEETQLTEGTDAWIQGMAWSPDGSTIAATDTQNRLWVVDPATRERRVLDTATEASIGGMSWSPDSRWICYTKTGRNGYRSVYVVSVADGEVKRVTSEDWNDGSCCFDPKGRYLYFVSARDFVYGDLGFEQRVYALMLRPSVGHPIHGDLDADTVDDGEPIEIDFDGIERRTVVLPMSQGSYFGLLGHAVGVAYRSGGSTKVYDLSAKASKTILDGPGLTTSASGQRVVYRSGDGLKIASLRPGLSTGGETVDLSDVRVRVQPAVEWEQMYRDAWRIMRDFFYDPTMHSVDWAGMYAKYLPLAQQMSHRTDLDYLLGELIGELNAGHTYVNESREQPGVERETAASLGCEFEAVDGHYRIAVIFDGENWNEATRSPLREPGVDVAVGDFVLAIDGEELTATDNPYRHLIGKVGRRIELLVNDRPSTLGARTIEVTPRRGDQPLRYITWVNNNRRIVDEMSGGRIGYIHVPNTAVPGHRELYEGWYAQARAKEAMLIDDRYNGGGFIPDRMAHLTADGVLNWWARRHVELGSTPSYGFDGPRAMLINGYSSSGGDAFPFYFRKLGAGKLIGSTTWGGLIGYSGSPRLVDGGGLAVPSFSFVNTDGEWDVEAFGVKPDIEVFDDPTQIQAGREPVLEAGVRHLLEELKTKGGFRRPPVPAYPDRRKPVDPATAPGG